MLKGSGKNYHWDKSLNQFVVDVQCEGRNFYVASRKDEAEAAQIAEEARACTTREELLLLRATYAKRPKASNGANRNGHHVPKPDIQDNPRDDPEDAAPFGAVPDGLYQAALDEADAQEARDETDESVIDLLRAALAAQREADIAQTQVRTKMKAAKEAWTAFNEALETVHRSEVAS